jgi:hypothetical protein
LKIKKPIFLNCFSRGGSNIFWNFFLSHPGVCSPIRETLQIFGTGIRHASLEGYITALLSRQRRIFDQWNLNVRKHISTRTQGYIDRTFYRWVQKTSSDSEMKYKSENIPYTQAEVETCRMAAKNNNGLVFLTEILGDMYPEAVFFDLVRHPFALFDGHKRHKILREPDEFVRFYNSVGGKMIRDAENHSNCHLVRFEDLLEGPTGFIQELYRSAGLDFDPARKIRLKAKPYLHADGSRRSDLESGRHFWIDLDHLEQFLESDINRFQAKRLTEREKEIIRAGAGSLMEKLGYE